MNIHMNINFSVLQVLAARILKLCLNNRHLYLYLIIIIATTISCGRVPNKVNGDSNHLLMEGQCLRNTSGVSKITRAIQELYLISSQNYPLSFFFVKPRYYNYEHPLVLSAAGMEKTYLGIKDDPVSIVNAEELFYLMSGSQRFEDQKCAFKYLSQKKIYDLRPYLNIVHHCSKKYQSETCDAAEFVNLEPEKERWARDNALDLCRSFSNENTCQYQYKKSKADKTLGSMIQYYSDRFERERFAPLFKLRPTHSKYRCEVDNSDGEKTVMLIKVMGNSFLKETLIDLLAHVETVWSSQTFALQFEIVNQYSPEVVTILPSNKGISYVPDNNNRLVYLSTTIDLAIMKHVLAHEFGHVLGFPDCYIEFFDNAKRELVYYEIADKNTNIMCSLKNNVRVQDDYFTQLKQKSCLFN